MENEVLCYSSFLQNIVHCNLQLFFFGFEDFCQMSATVLTQCFNDAVWCYFVTVSCSSNSKHVISAFCLSLSSAMQMSRKKQHLSLIFMNLHSFFTHAVSSHVSKAFSSVYECVILCVILSICLHGKTKTAETKIVKLCTLILVQQLILGQRSRSQDHKVQKNILKALEPGTVETTVTKTCHRNSPSWVLAGHLILSQTTF